MILLKKPLVIFIFTAAIAVYILQWQHVNLPIFINNYLNNLLCLPVVLTICLAFLQLIKKNYQLTIPIFVIASVTFYYIVYFEWYLPKVDPRYTADVIDIFLYILGAIFFYFIQKHWIVKKK